MQTTEILGGGDEEVTVVEGAARWLAGIKIRKIGSKAHAMI